MSERSNIIDIGLQISNIEAEILANRKALEGFKEEIKASKKALSDNKKEISGYNNALLVLQKSQNQLKTAYKSGSISLQEYTASSKKINAEIQALNKKSNEAGKAQNRLTQNIIANENKVKALQVANRELNTLYQAGRKEIKGNEGAYKELNKELNALKTEAKNLGAEMLVMERAGKQNTKAYQDLKQKHAEVSANANKLNENFKNLDKSVGDNQRNVGNYESGLVGLKENFKETIRTTFDLQRASEHLLGRFGTLAPLLVQSVQSLRAYASVQYASAVATSGTSKALKIFRLALISTGIGAIVVVLGSLITYLSTTQKGIDAVSRVTMPLKVIFQKVLGVVQGLGETIAGAFSNPKKAVIGLWQTIKTNIVNRITAIGGIFKSLGKIISSGFTDGYKDLANATLQMTTGVEDVIGKTKKAGKAVAGFMKEAVSQGQQLADLQVQIEQAENDLVVRKSELIDKIKEQEQIAKDTSKTSAERNNAIEEAKRLSDELASKETNILDLKIKQKKLQNSLNDTSREEEKELNEMIAERNRKRTEARARELKFLGSKNSLQKEVQAKHKKAQDDAIKHQERLLELYILTSKKDNSSLKEKQERIEKIYKDELDLIKEKAKVKKWSATQIAIEEEKAREKKSASLVSLALENATKELEIYTTKNAHILDSEGKLNADLLAKQKAFLDEKARLQIEALQKEQLSAEEFQAKKEQIERERDTAKREKDNTYREQQKADRQKDFEDKQALRKLDDEIAIQDLIDSASEIGAGNGSKITSGRK